jgi:Na+-translocating ferredoxin:NAD+ oxidoreductase RnfG subunit
MFSRKMTKGDKMAISIFLFTLVIIVIVILPGMLNNSINNFKASTIHFAYGQSNQLNSSYDNNNNTNSADVQNIEAKKVHVGDIDIAYKLFGKGEPLLFIPRFFTNDGYVGSLCIRQTVIKSYNNYF